MTQLVIAHMKLKMIHKLIQKSDPCVNTFACAFYDFTVNCQSRCLVIHIAVVLLLCYCK